ncbi:MAG: DUF4177 domain-containing protein [Candidatus Dadabacteria bacterium]|jgi:hypothetical protein|nr:DUF4177 domain-containing protein [Candidatus Dadabacteria bacterium]
MADYPHYKVVELPHVTDEEIEKALNTWTGEGWVFDGIHFVVKDSSKRPTMAFIFFTSGAVESEGTKSV